MVSTKWIENFQNLNEILELRLNSQKDPLDATSIHLLVYEDNFPVACGRITPVAHMKGVKLFIDYVTVHKKHLNKGFGGLVLRMLIRKAYNLGAEYQYVYIKDELLGFYGRFGFSKTDIPGIKNEKGYIYMMRFGDITSNC